MPDVARSQPARCDCCQYTTCLKEYKRPSGGDWSATVSFFYCDLCASTDAGISSENPHPEDGRAVEIMKTICYVGNAILDAIKDARPR
jgi:hypothetical protein